jgi:hypothetical protein
MYTMTCHKRQTENTTDISTASPRLGLEDDPNTTAHKIVDSGFDCVICSFGFVRSRCKVLVDFESAFKDSCDKLGCAQQEVGGDIVTNNDDRDPGQNTSESDGETDSDEIQQSNEDYSQKLPSSTPNDLNEWKSKVQTMSRADIMSPRVHQAISTLKKIRQTYLPRRKSPPLSPNSARS